MTCLGILSVVFYCIGQVDDVSTAGCVKVPYHVEDIVVVSIPMHCLIVPTAHVTGGMGSHFLKTFNGWTGATHLRPLTQNPIDHRYLCVEFIQELISFVA